MTRDHNYAVEVGWDELIYIRKVRDDVFVDDDGDDASVNILVLGKKKQVLR